MKITLNPAQFNFIPSTNTVDFSPMLGDFKPYRLLAITNVTTGKLIYSVAGQPNGYNGTFSTTTYPNDTLTYVSSNAGQSASDIIEVLYDSDTAAQLVGGSVTSLTSDSSGNGIGSVVDPTGGYKLKTASNTYAGDGTPILSTVDPVTGGDGLNVHLQSSTYGGQLGSPLPSAGFGYQGALSMGFLNGSVLAAPKMDPVTNELIVQANFAATATQNVNLTEVNGSAVSLNQTLMANSLPVAIASDQSAVPITTNSPIEVSVAQSVSQDILGVAIGGNRNNQIEISFNSAPGATLITNTFTGTGAATVSNGHTIYSVGATPVSSSKGVSVQTTTYRPLHESYAAFTAAFLDSVSSSNQRIGLFDTSNGFFLGFSGTQFGITVRNAGSDVFTPQGGFNVDTLTGSSTSKFTRDGVPEALVFTVSNLYRIRFAWLGSANIFFEVFSPDGEWVLFHNIRQPNTSYTPSIQQPNLPMTVEVTKTAGSNNPSIATACWGAGTTSAFSPITATLSDTTLAAMTRSVITGVTTGGGGGYVNVKVNPSGALVTDSTISGVPTVDITRYGGTSTTLGQKAISASIPVVLPSDQIVSTTLPDSFITGQAAQSAAINNIIPATASSSANDVSGYRTAYVQVVASAGITAGAITFEVSNDNSNFQATPVFNQSLITGATTSGAISVLANTQIIYAMPITARYFRLRISTLISGGTVQAFTRLTQASYAPAITTVTQPTAAQLNATVTGSLSAVTTVSTVTTCSTVTSVSSITAANLASTIVTDLNAQSVITTGVSGNIATANQQSHSFGVTVVYTTGTGSVDVTIQESYDNGNSWVDVYTLDRVATAGTVRQQIPAIKIGGNLVRYSWVVTGSITTATLTVARTNRAGTAPYLRRIYDRTLVPATLASNTAAVFTEGCEYLDLIVNMAAGGTAPVIQLQGSEDSTNWYNIGSGLTATVGATTALNIADGSLPRFTRATVGTAGTGSTLGYVALKAKGAS